MAVTVVQGGPRGDKGDPGPPGIGNTQVFTFPNPLDTWTCAHHLGRLPYVITAFDTAGNMRPLMAVSNPDLNTTILNPNPPLAGQVVIS
jgi:hypothetical protein